MKRVGFIAACLVFGSFLAFLTVPVRAECIPDSDFYCTGDEFCAPDGSCSAQSCCSYPPEPPPGGVTCECGTKTDGTCKACTGGGTCNADYIVNCASGTKTQQITNTACVRIRTACKESDGSMKVGTAQSLGGCCEEWEVDGETACRSMTVNTYTCCPTGTVADCRTEGTNYERDNDCRTPTKCTNVGDNYISHRGAPETTANRCYKTCNESSCEWVYNVITTCRSNRIVCDCVASCTATAPTNLSVVQGASATSANVSWSVGSGGVSQRLYVDQSASEVDAGCPTANACEVKATLSSSTTSYPVTGLLPSTAYYFRVETYKNSSCHPGVRRSYTTPSVTLSGRVYLDSNNNCSTATPWNLGGLTVSVRGTSYSGSVGSNGRFGFYGGNSNPIAYLDLTGYNSSYIPSTASGCNQGATLTNVANPSSTNYYYLTPYREAWWQAIGGSIYSSGNVRSQLPSASTNLIDPGAGGGYGALMRAAGSVDTGSGGVSTQGYSALTKYRGKLMNYGYFAAHMGVTPNTPNDWVVDTLVKPSNNPERSFYYINPTGIEASITTPWTVANGESYVIFVDGDLRISSEVVVETGGFLALIVKGNLRISPAVTQVQGMYVLNNNLITESNGGSDSKLTFEGSVVAWGGVNLGRDLGASNAASPAEQFVYRTDLLTNMPEEMKVFALRWQEVVPGTIGN